MCGLSSSCFLSIHSIFLIHRFLFILPPLPSSTFIALGSNITADGDCSHEIKRRLLLERKAMTNLDSILKSRDITLPTKVHLVKALFFLVSLVWM